MDVKQALENREGLKLPPFEFVALEACLEAACSCLEFEVNSQLCKSDVLTFFYPRKAAVLFCLVITIELLLCEN